MEGDNHPTIPNMEPMPQVSCSSQKLGHSCHLRWSQRPTNGQLLSQELYLL
uniref:Uncharacterized protein n=1 Tax=Arundo donax TaxID=35708 RepID=A0A0A9ETX1_ARUDO